MKKVTASDIALVFSMTLEEAEMWHKEFMKKKYSSTSKAEQLMEDFNDRIGGFGVEAIFGTEYSDEWPVLLYINMGDSYEDTILYNVPESEFLIGSWGDFVEKYEDIYGIM